MGNSSLSRLIRFGVSQFDTKRGQSECDYSMFSRESKIAGKADRSTKLGS